MRSFSARSHVVNFAQTSKSEHTLSKTDRSHPFVSFQIRNIHYMREFLARSHVVNFAQTSKCGHTLSKSARSHVVNLSLTS